MCGICGWQGDLDAADIAVVMERIAHRGPDDAGYHKDPGWTLGHRRLAILDLSPLGHQPMHHRESGVTLAYNGELYNFQYLRGLLEQCGHHFESRCDTEVVLHAYLEWGTAAFARFNGIFAAAIADPRTGEMVLVRDQLGVKPLYLSQLGASTVFASELKALLLFPGLSRRLDPAAVPHYLGLLWSPAPVTMLADVERLPQGTFIVLKDGREIHRERYYELPFGRVQHDVVDEDDAIKRIDAAVGSAVGRQLIADVPVGAFLSGGLDSSAIVAHARQQLDESFPCFTIDAGSGDGFADDLPYARSVAEHLDVQLQEVKVEPDTVEDLQRLVFHLDQPQADPAPLHVLRICRLARECGIKVLLSGVGGDDIFTGYRRHRALELECWWSWMPRPMRSLVRSVSNCLPRSSTAGRRIAKAFGHAHLDGPRRMAGQFQWLQSDWLGRLLGDAVRPGVGDAGEAAVAPLLETLGALPSDCHPLDAMLNLECTHFLADHNLPYTDAMSMAVGVEVRVPLLDLELVDLAARIKPRLRQRGGVGKYLFKRACESRLPHGVIHRPKTGFGVPLRTWMHGSMADLVDDVLGSASFANRGLIDPEAARALRDSDRAGRVDGTYSLYAIVCMELWCRIFLDTDPQEWWRHHVMPDLGRGMTSRAVR